MAPQSIKPWRLKAPLQRNSRRRGVQVARGLITIKDILKAQKQFPPSKDEHGRLRVAAAVGVQTIPWIGWRA